MKTLLVLSIALPLFAQIPSNLPSVAVPAPTGADIAAGRILGVNGWQNPPTGGTGGGGGTTIQCTSQPAPGILTIDGMLGSQRICLGVGLYQFSATFPLTASKISIVGAGPGTILQRSAGVDGIVATGSDISIEDLTYAGAGTSMGYAIKATGDRFKCRGVYFTGFGQNSGRGLAMISKSTGSRWVDCNWLDSPNEHNLVVTTENGNVSDLIIGDSHLSSSGVCPGPGQQTACTGLAMLGVPGGYIYSFEVSRMTYSGQGRALYMLLNANKPRTGSVSGFTAELTGSVVSELFGVWGCDGVTFSDITGTDNNFAMANQPLFAFHDANSCHLKGFTAKMLNINSQAFLALDSRYSSLDGFHIYGGGGNMTNNSGRGMVEFGMGAPGSSNSGSMIRGGTIEMPNGATNYAIRTALGFGPSDVADDFKISDVTVKGTGAGTGIFVQTGNGANFASPLINGFQLSNLNTGINISSGVTNAMIGVGQYRIVTTPLVNNGTGTVIK